MTTRKQAQERMRMPGQEPTDEDLRADVELTRQELAQTVSALSARADVRSRVRTAARQRAEAVRAGGDDLVARLPDPVAQRVRPIWTKAADHPGGALAALLAMTLLLRALLRVARR